MARVIAVILTVILLSCSLVHAQMVFVARKALGVIQRLNTQNDDVATVLLEADAEKVYRTALAILEGKQNLRITRRDDSDRVVEFTDGQRSVGMKISRIGENVSQLLVSSAASAGKASGTSLALDGILRVCREMSVHCVLASE